MIICRRALKQLTHSLASLASAGKNGSKIEALRTGTGTRIVFPSESDKDCEIITIMGKREDVEKAKEQLEKLIKDLVRTDGAV